MGKFLAKKPNKTIGVNGAGPSKPGVSPMSPPTPNPPRGSVLTALQADQIARIKAAQKPKR